MSVMSIKTFCLTAPQPKNITQLIQHPQLLTFSISSQYIFFPIILQDYLIIISLKKHLNYGIQSPNHVFAVILNKYGRYRNSNKTETRYCRCSK